MNDQIITNDGAEALAKAIHYPDCWDTMAYPTLFDALVEISHCDPEQCTKEQEP